MKKDDLLLYGALAVGGYFLLKSGVIGGLSKVSEGVGDAVGGVGDAVEGVGGFVGDIFSNIGGFFGGLAGASEKRSIQFEEDKNLILSDLRNYGTGNVKIGKSDIPVYASPTQYNQAISLPISQGLTRYSPTSSLKSTKSNSSSSKTSILTGNVVKSPIVTTQTINPSIISMGTPTPINPSLKTKENYNYAKSLPVSSGLKI